jgi:glycylpeptide N-tetradecanoyltransferase
LPQNNTRGNWKNLYHKYFLIHLNTDWKPEVKHAEPADNKGLYMPLPGVPDQPTPQSSPLPGDFEWFEYTQDEIMNCDLENTSETDPLHALYLFLDQNTVEDEDGIFRLHHTKYQLRRLMLSSLPHPHVFLAVRVKQSRRLCGFISATPTVIRSYSKTFEAFTVQQLTVHKKLRGKKLARLVRIFLYLYFSIFKTFNTRFFPLVWQIVRELARRIQLKAPHIQQAVFALGVDMPFNCVSEARIWHRPLNARKLVDLQYLLASDQESQLARKERTPELTLMTEADLESAWRLTCSYLERFPFAPTLTLSEFGNKYFPKEKEVYSYVMKSGDTVTDFVCFFVLRQRALSANDVVTSAFVEFCIGGGAARRKLLLEDVLIVAKQEGLDQVQCIDIMDHSEFLETLGFHQGSGRMVYYLHNWIVGGKLDRKSWANTLL